MRRNPRTETCIRCGEVLKTGAKKKDSGPTHIPKSKFKDYGLIK